MWRRIVNWWIQDRCPQCKSRLTYLAVGHFTGGAPDEKLRYCRICEILYELRTRQIVGEGPCYAAEIYISGSWHQLIWKGEKK